MILAIDLGNYSVKTSEGINFISSFKEYDQADVLENKVLTFEGKSYVMEKESSFDNEFNKSQKDYLPNLLWALDKSCSKEVTTVQLVLGVPVSNLGLTNKLKADLEGKTFTYEVQGSQPRTITIEKLACVGEGVSAFYTLTSEQRSKDVMIIDIGGRTTNVVTFRNGRIEHKKTLNKRGMIDYYQEVEAEHNFNGNNILTHEVKNLIEKGLIKADINKCQSNLINQILNDIKTIANIDYYEPFFTGGGATELFANIQAIEPRANLIKESVYANANGNKKIALAQWNK